MPALDRILPQVQSLKLHQYLGIGPIRSADGRATFDITVDDRTANPSGTLHGGVLYTLCDVACYTALLSVLEEGEDAVTHNIQVSVLRPALLGDTVSLIAQVLKRGRSLAFMEAEARCGDRLLARASLTKSIILANGR